MYRTKIDQPRPTNHFMPRVNLIPRDSTTQHFTHSYLVHQASGPGFNLMLISNFLNQIM